MQITLGAITLCHGATTAIGDYTGPDALRITLSREVQVCQAIGAEEVTLAARKNAVWTLSFSAVAEFESIEAALSAAQTLAEQIREEGETPGTLTLGKGAQATTWQQAILTGFEAVPIGCSLHVAYTLTATQQGTTP